MNRDILFRAKRKLNGNWVYGYYVYNEDENKHLIYAANLTMACFEVLPETVGMFTGLLDCNEQKIFDGDLVNFTFFTYHEYEVEETKKGVIWFNGTAFYFVEKTEDDEINYLLDELTFDSKSDIEITDNIHETK